MYTCSGTGLVNESDHRYDQTHMAGPVLCMHVCKIIVAIFAIQLWGRDGGYIILVKHV